MFEEAKSEALRALEMFEKLGAADHVEETRWLLEEIDVTVQEMDSDPRSHPRPDKLGDDGELLETVATCCVYSIFVFRQGR